MVKILIIDDDYPFVKKLLSYLSKGNYELKYYNSNNFKLPFLSDYQIVIMDLIYNYCDSIYLINEIKNYNHNIKIIVLSSIFSHKMFNQLNNSNIDLLLSKNNSLKSLFEHLDLTINTNNYYLKEYINNLLNDIGLSSKLHAYHYISFILEEMVNKNLSIDTNLYQIIANKFHKEKRQIERCLRYAIKVCFDRKYNALFIEEVFGCNYNPERGQPTNLEFIHTLVNRIKINI